MTCYHSSSLYPISLAYVHLPLMVNSFGLSNDEYALTIYGLLIHGILRRGSMQHFLIFFMFNLPPDGSTTAAFVEGHPKSIYKNIRKCCEAPTL